MRIHFTKYQGTGNDFILIDQRANQYALTRAQIAQLCDRRFGIGGDGLILLQSAPAPFDFEMKNYNSDGGECSMCGNGARTLVQFAHDLDLPTPNKNHYRFLAIDGEHEAKIENGLIHLKMQPVQKITETPNGFVLNTGSPHLVCTQKNLMTLDVVTEGRKLRNSPMFMPSGININFIESYGEHIFVRTYERGVEDETLSCGTGVIASALTALPHPLGMHEVQVQTRGGRLSVQFNKKSDEQFEEIWLTGPAKKTFQGMIEL